MQFLLAIQALIGNNHIFVVIIKSSKEDHD